MSRCTYDAQHRAAAPSRRGPVTMAIGVASALALITFAVINLSTSPVRAADADPAFKAQCEQALGYPDRTEQDVAFLQQCAHALRLPDVPTTPPTGPTGSPTPEPTTATPTPSMSTTPVPTTSTTATPSPSGPSPSASSPTPTPTPTGTPPPASWPDRTNTGYANAPGYPGQLTAFTGTLKSNTTYRFLSFPAGFTIRGVVNVTFYGCKFPGVFHDTGVDTNVAISGGTNITFDYSSFVPLNVSAPPVAHTDSSQFGIREDTQSPPANVTVAHSDFWGFANAIAFMGNRGSATNIFTVRDSYFHDARDPGNEDHTDGILNNVNNPSSGQYIQIIHNTIVSKGNTNGIALQDTQGDRHVLIQNNYISGWGYSVQMGGPPNQDVRFIDNVLATDIQHDWGYIYGWWAGPGNLFRNNRIHFVPGTAVMLGSHKIVAADEGRFLWPDNTVHATDYTGA